MRKNILITGASTGLGEGMARLFASQGCNLALCARRLEQLQTLQQELLTAHPNITVSVRALDVNDHEQVFSVFGAFAKEFGQLDRIIINAGIASSRIIGTGHFKENKQTAETNFVAALAQCEAAVEILRKQNSGHLVTMSSIAAARGFGGNFSVYCATKAAVACLTEGIRVDLLGTPIRVTTIYPGYILTDINRDIKKAPFRVDRDTGCRHLVAAINSEVNEAFVPAWPWRSLNFMAKQLPVQMLSRFNAS